MVLDVNLILIMILDVRLASAVDEVLQLFR